MGVRVYVNASGRTIAFDSACRIEWQERPIEVMRYNKKTVASESWCVLYDAPTGGNEVARFRGSEVWGFAGYKTVR